MEKSVLLCLLLLLFSVTAVFAQTPTTTDDVPPFANELNPEGTGVINLAPTRQFLAETFKLMEGSATTTSFGVGVNIPLPQTATPTPLIVEIKELDFLELPEIAWASTTTSTVWQMDIKRKPPLVSPPYQGGDGEVSLEQWLPQKPIAVILPTTGPFYYKKIISFWDDRAHSWRDLPSTTDFDENTVSARYPLGFGRFIIRENSAVFEGRASWYKWKHGNYAAFRFLPKKTKLKVTNISISPRSGKSVMITVNDYGPEEWTGRLIDLEYHAYRHIGIPRGGLMWVRVEPVGKSQVQNPNVK